MSKNEIKILKAVALHKNGLLSPQELFHEIAQGDKRSAEHLVARGYLLEIPQEQSGIMGGSSYIINFYRITDKGLFRCERWHKRLWFGIKGDIRTIITSSIVAFITTLRTIFVGALK